jgi:hypothetical protein
MVKYISVILAIILFMPVLRTCKGAIWEQDVWFSQEQTSCSINQKGATCCSKANAPVEDDHHSEEEGDCGDSCCCYCCTTVIVQNSPIQSKSNQTSSTPPISWLKDGYIHEFNDLIWQPPPFL